MKKFLRKIPFLTLGATIAGFALEGFLVPNNIIDGGIIGISIMVSYITKIQLGLLIVILNLPFIFVAWKKFGKQFVASTLYSVCILAISVTLFHGHHATDDLTLACIFGGVVLGIGVGLILRSGGSLDGTEIVSIKLAKNSSFSIGEIIMFFNIFIFISAGFLYGFDRAMYSMLTYFIAYKVIDVVLEGLNESKSLQIVTEFPKKIGDEIIAKMDTSVTYIKAKGGYSGNDKTIIYCVTSRLELTKLKQLIKDIDPSAFIAVENVHEVEGTRFKKNKKLSK